MSNLWQEIQANLDHNPGFREFCESMRILHTNMYGVQEVICGEERNVRKAWKSAHKVWYKDSFEWELSVDAMPLGGWKSEKEEADFLKSLRKINQASNREVRDFMRAWTQDENWDF